jgi:hypothetical protein
MEPEVVAVRSVYDAAAAERHRTFIGRSPYVISR